MLKNRRWVNLAIVALFAAFVYGAAQLYLLRFTTGDVFAPYSTFRTDPLGAKAYYEALEDMPGLWVERLLQPFNVESIKQSVGNRAATVFVIGASADDPDHAPLEFVRAAERVMVEGGRVVIAFAPTSENLREQWEDYEARRKRLERRRKGEQEDNGSQEKASEESKETPQEEEHGEPQSAAVPTSPRAEKEPPESQEETVPEQETSTAPETSEESSSTSGATEEVKEQENEDNGEKAGEKEEDDEEEDESSPYDALYADVDIPERWGVRLTFSPVQVTADHKMRSERAEWKAGPGLPSTVSWHTATSFEDLSDEWRVLYERNAKPVLIERPFGAGSLVMSSDSFFLSNEALRNERHPKLLAYLVGPNRLVAFDESHLGIGRQPGIMTLAKAYGLYGVFGGLVLLAFLYIWQNSVSFVPPYEDEVLIDARHAAGKDSAAGFANLIRRGVLARDVLDTCLSEYTRSLGHRKEDLAEPLERMRAIAGAERVKPSNQWNPVEAYRQMCRVLAEYLGRRS